MDSATRTLSYRKQKIIHLKPSNNTFCFRYEKFIVSKASEVEYLKLVTKWPKKLRADNIRRNYQCIILPNPKLRVLVMPEVLDLPFEARTSVVLAVQGSSPILQKLNITNE